MQHDDDLAGRDTDHQRYVNGQPSQLGIGRSIRPHTAVPATVLVADMCDGGLLLQGWGDGSSAYLSSSDAIPLRRELAAAFGSTELAPCDNPGETL